jgi:transketolase
VTGRQIRSIILEQSHRAHHGHIGCSLSVADMLAALYGRIMNLPSPTDPQRDYLVLSKGHAALGLYAALFLKGWISREQLESYCGENSLLGVHPEYGLPGVEWSTGSLGQGLSVAAGMALAARLRKNPRRVFALLSDAECNEGSVWEAAMFAGHHRLENLTVLVDWNGQQALGSTQEILRQSNLPERWSAFGWETREVDGHDLEALAAAAQRPAGEPRVILARTVFGKGVSFMENQLKWHYLPLSDKEYSDARREVEASP